VFNITSDGQVFKYSRYGEFNNEGTLDLGHYTSNCEWIFTQSGTGKIVSRLSDASTFGQITFVTALTLNGTLDAALTSSYAPRTDSLYKVITHGARTGTFSKVTKSGPGATYFTAQYNPGDVTLQARPNTLSVDPVTRTEGNSGTSAMNFTLRLSAPSSQTVTVKYATSDGSAKVGKDFNAASGTASFAPGETSKVVSVAVIGDLLDESNEFLKLNFSQASGATLTSNQALGTITDDDGAPSISINDVRVLEDNTVNVNANLTVKLSNPSGQTVKVNFATANGTALSSSDYFAKTGTLTFAPGESSKVVTIVVRGDTIDEIHEQFEVRLTGPVNASIADGTGIGTITDNEPPPAISVKSASVTEGNAGSVSLPFEINLSGHSSRTVTVQIRTIGAKNLPATAGVDYLALPTTTLSFAPGETRKVVNVAIKGDTLDEENERVGLELKTPVNAVLGNGSLNGVLTAEGTILDDDASPLLSIGDVSVTEGNSGTRSAVFTVSISARSGREVSVGFSTVAGSALSGSDYMGQSGSLTFAPGQTSKTISIPVIGDTRVESTEKFSVLLSRSLNASINRATGTATILNDDSSGITASNVVADLAPSAGNS
jgi:hypothetical protein